MKYTAMLISLFATLLALGALSGIAFAGSSAEGNGTTDTTQTVADTATDPVTTATDTETTPTTTVGTTTAAATEQPPIDQAATQGNSAAPTVPPTAPCDPTRITCGNNASTQIAVVSQNCQANSANSTLTVDVTTIAGTPVNNFTIANVTTCMNVLSITQVVQQFCAGCTVIVIPPPPPVVVQEIPAPPVPARAFYCVTNLDSRSLVQLVLGQPDWDPAYKGAILASVDVSGVLRCPDLRPTLVASTTPMFTLTVPASFVGQFVNLCIQPANAALKPVCHSVKINAGATISIPVTASVAATVSASPTAKVRTAAEISAASKKFVVKPVVKRAKHVTAKKTKSSKRKVVRP